MCAELSATLALVADLWLHDMTLNQIAVRLGVSRSAVAGRVARARLRGDPRFGLRAPGNQHTTPRNVESKPSLRPPREKRVAAPVAPVAVAPAVVAVEAAPRRGRLLIEMGWRDCRYAIGAALDGRHMFCGRPQARGRPYCAACDELVRGSRVSSSPTSSFPASPRAPSRLRESV